MRALCHSVCGSNVKTSQVKSKNPASQGRLAGLVKRTKGEVRRFVWVDQGRDRIHDNGHCIRCVSSDHRRTDKFVNWSAFC